MKERRATFTVNANANADTATKIHGMIFTEELVPPPTTHLVISGALHIPPCRGAAGALQAYMSLY